VSLWRFHGVNRSVDQNVGKPSASVGDLGERLAVRHGTGAAGTSQQLEEGDEKAPSMELVQVLNAKIHAPR
jgi:hypothetical protein